jgi:hypothetical protein
MDDAMLMRRMHRPGQRLEQGCGLTWCLRLAPQSLSQVSPADVLQGQEREAVVLADLIDLDDVGVLQAGDGVGLGQEAGAPLGASVGAGEHHLQRHQAFGAELSGLVDHTHAAAAQLFQDLVAGHLDHWTVDGR